MLVSISIFFSRSWRAISMRPCHPVHCTRRAVKGLRDYATSTVDSQRRGAKREGRHAGGGASVRSGLHGDKSGDRGTRKRGGIFQVSSAMRHRWGRAVTRVLTCVGVHVRPCGASTHGDCTGRRRDQGARPTEILHFSSAVGHWALVRCAGFAMGMALGGRRGSRGCQGRTRLRK